MPPCCCTCYLHLRVAVCCYRATAAGSKQQLAGATVGQLHVQPCLLVIEPDGSPGGKAAARSVLCPRQHAKGGTGRQQPGAAAAAVQRRHPSGGISRCCCVCPLIRILRCMSGMPIQSAYTQLAGCGSSAQKQMCRSPVLQWARPATNYQVTCSHSLQLAGAACTRLRPTSRTNCMQKARAYVCIWHWCLQVHREEAHPAHCTATGCRGCTGSSPPATAPAHAQHCVRTPWQGTSHQIRPHAGSLPELLLQ
jgi:hypothetical protein